MNKYEKKVLLKSVAVMMGMFMLAPSFGNVAFAVNPEEEQHRQYKRQRCSTEEDFTDEVENSIDSNQRKRKKTNLDPEKVGKYIIELSKEKGRKITYKEVAKKFNVKEKTIYNYVEQLRSTKPQLYNDVSSILGIRNQLNQLSPKEVGWYIVSNKATQEQAAEHFRVSTTTISGYVGELRYSNPSLYKKVKSIGIQNRVKSRMKANPEEESDVNDVYEGIEDAEDEASEWLY